MFFLHIYIYIYTFFPYLSYIWLCIYLYIYIYLLVINAKHENVIRCPVLLASDEVMKFIFPSKVSVFSIARCWQKGILFCT